jgi:hypothetical protein
VPFVVDPKGQPFLEGLSVDVTHYWGRDALVAHHAAEKSCG